MLADGLATSELNRLLVEAGVARVPARARASTLEERFLDITSRLEVNS